MLLLAVWEGLSSRLQHAASHGVSRRLTAGSVLAQARVKKEPAPKKAPAAKKEPAPKKAAAGKAAEEEEGEEVKVRLQLS